MRMLGFRGGLVAGLAITSLLGVALWAGADDNRHRVKATLSGYQETPLTLSTAGTGEFSAKIDDEAETIEYELSYSGLEAPAVAAHIHLGARATSGGVIAFLCGGGDKEACPAGGGTVTGTIDATDVIGPAGQGIAPGQFAKVVRAIRSGAVYANIHTTVRPGGEIRGHLRVDRGDQD